MDEKLKQDFWYLKSLKCFYKFTILEQLANRLILEETEATTCCGTHIISTDGFYISHGGFLEAEWWKSHSHATVPSRFIFAHF